MLEVGNLTRYLADRGGQLFRGRGHGLNIGTRLLGCDGHFADLHLCLLVGRRHRLRGALHFGRSRRDELDDALDARFEAVGKRHHTLAAFLFRPPLGFFLLFAETIGIDRILLEHFHGLGHRADLIAALGAGDFDRLVALGQALHNLGHSLDRVGDAVADEPRQEGADDHGDRDSVTDHDVGGADRRFIGCLTSASLGQIEVFAKGGIFGSS